MTTLPDRTGHAEIIRAAADIVEANGRATGAVTRPAPGREPRGWPVCVLGAIRLAAGAPYPSERIHAALVAEIELAGWLVLTRRVCDAGSPAATIAAWSDPIAGDGELVAALRRLGDEMDRAAREQTETEPAGC